MRTLQRCGVILRNLCLASAKVPCLLLSYISVNTRNRKEVIGATGSCTIKGLAHPTDYLGFCASGNSNWLDVFVENSLALH